MLVDEKKDTPVGGQAMSVEFTNDVVVTKSISQKSSSGKKFGGKRQPKILGNEAKVPNVALKFYDEQLPNGWDYTIEQIEKLDGSKYQAIGICHDKDEVTDGIWDIALEKRHYHVIFRCVNRKERIRIKTIMSMLGIEFRKGQDESLWVNHGVETVGDFSAYANYLTHETAEAISDGKHLYAVTELVSNLNLKGIEQVRDGYTRILKDELRVTTADLMKLDEEAWQLGYDLKNFQLWYDSLPFVIRSHSKVKTIRERYKSGVDQRIVDNVEVTRLCIFIEGDANTGKTYASERAIPANDIVTVRGGGSGKFDKLRPDHKGILIDDDICPNLLNMTDNYPCYVYKRNSGNPVWSGDHFIVTSNKNFEDWLEDCGIKTRYYQNGNYVRTKHLEAMISRFYICRVEEDQGVNKLKLLSPSTRGTNEEQLKRLEMFVSFRDKFNDTISRYTPKSLKIDYSNIIGFGN